LSSQATTDGVRREPSSLTMTLGSLPSMMATTLLVVPRSMPMILPMPSTVNCACGNVIETQSTRGDFTTDVCNNCHPFYTGKQKLMDQAGRVDRFRKKYAAVQK
jgi:large subunit ribosomal protein L31